MKDWVYKLICIIFWLVMFVVFVNWMYDIDKLIYKPDCVIVNGLCQEHAR